MKFNECSSSSSVGSLLPGRPKIFHGRETELDNIIGDLLHKTPAHIAILGPGGIGKSSLALAALHDERVIDAFSDRYFIPCDSAYSAGDLVSLIATYFGIVESSKPTKAIVKYLAKLSGQAVLVLDNLETSWEPHSSRSAVEEFLSQLADMKHLALIVSAELVRSPAC